MTVDPITEAAEMVDELRATIALAKRDAAILRSLISTLILRVREAGYSPLASLMEDDVREVFRALDEGRRAS